MKNFFSFFGKTVWNFIEIIEFRCKRKKCVADKLQRFSSVRTIDRPSTRRRFLDSDETGLIFPQNWQHFNLRKKKLSQNTNCRSNSVKNLNSLLADYRGHIIVEFQSKIYTLVHFDYWPYGRLWKGNSSNWWATTGKKVSPGYIFLIGCSEYTECAWERESPYWVMWCVGAACTCRGCEDWSEWEGIQGEHDMWMGREVSRVVLMLCSWSL